MSCESIRLPYGIVDVETLRWFVAVGDGTTVGDTADAFHTSQPAVTRALQRLSRELGVPLTERVGRRLRPTFAGRIFLDSARRVVDELDAAARAIAEANDPSSGTIRFGFLNPLGAWLVPELLVAFRAQRPAVRFELRHDGLTRILQAIEDGDLDLVLSTPPASEALRWEPLLDEELVLAVPATHRLAARRRVKVGELVDEAWVLQSPGYGLRQRAEEVCREAGFEPEVVFEGQDLTTLYALIGAGSGVGLFPVRPLPPAGVHQVAFTPRLHRGIGLVSAPGMVRSPSAEAFAELVRSHLGSVEGRRLL